MANDNNTPLSYHIGHRRRRELRRRSFAWPPCNLFIFTLPPGERCQCCYCPPKGRRKPVLCIYLRERVGFWDWRKHRLRGGKIFLLVIFVFYISIYIYLGCADCYCFARSDVGTRQWLLTQRRKALCLLKCDEKCRVSLRLVSRWWIGGWGRGVAVYLPHILV